MASDTRELESITVERTDGVVTITLRRPEKKNAADAAMWNELLDEFRSIASNPAERAVGSRARAGTAPQRLDRSTTESTAGAEVRSLA
jgi:1,4-dihydroxy-2-naphthoyl-CoA synthase